LIEIVPTHAHFARYNYVLYKLVVISLPVSNIYSGSPRGCGKRFRGLWCGGSHDEVTRLFSLFS